MRFTTFSVITLLMLSTNTISGTVYVKTNMDAFSRYVPAVDISLAHKFYNLWSTMNAQDRYDSLLQYYAQEHDLDWKLLKAQVRAESNFDPRAVSSAGAMGLAQFMPATWREIGEGIPFNPEESIRAQAKYMKRLLKFTNGELEWALASYNWGMGRVQKLRNRRQGTFYELTSEMPQETISYVDRILGFYKEYNGEIDYGTTAFNG